MRSRLRWTIIALLCVGQMIACFDPVNLSFALADTGSTRHYQLTCVVLRIPAGRVVDRCGAKSPLALASCFGARSAALRGRMAPCAVLESAPPKYMVLFLAD